MIRNARSTAPSSTARLAVRPPREPECRVAEHDQRPEMDPDDDPERIERLREVEPEMAPVGRAQIGRERICRHLQRREPGREDEQSGKDRSRRHRNRC